MFQKLGIWQEGAMNLSQAKPAPKQSNLNRLGDAGGFQQPVGWLQYDPLLLLYGKWYLSEWFKDSLAAPAFEHAIWLSEVNRKVVAGGVPAKRGHTIRHVY